MNTRLIKVVILFIVLCCSCAKKDASSQSLGSSVSKEVPTKSQELVSNDLTRLGKSRVDASELFSGYKFITSFSKKIKPETGLILRSYGANHNLPKDYPFKNEVVTITACYALIKTQKDTISLEQARGMLVSLMESMLISINSDSYIRQYLEIYPFTYDLLDISIRFEDENYIDLGTGISQVYFYRGKIKYERYDIKEYTGTYPARGKHYIIHEETYPEALAIVQKSGALTYFP